MATDNFDWASLPESDEPLPPPEPVEITGDHVKSALQEGGSAGFAIGLASALLMAFASDLPSLEKESLYFQIFFGSLIVVPLVWLPLKLGVVMASSSRGPGAGLLRLIYRSLAIIAGVAGIAVAVFIVLARILIATR